MNQSNPINMTERIFIVLYTHQKTKKAKTWHDGTLKISANHNRATLYDERQSRLDGLYIQASQVAAGEELESDRYLIQVEEEKVTSGGSALHQTGGTLCTVLANANINPAARPLAETTTLNGQGQLPGSRGFQGLRSSVGRGSNGGAHGLPLQMPKPQGLRVGLKRKKSGFVPPRQIKQARQSVENEKEEIPVTAMQIYREKRQAGDTSKHNQLLKPNPHSPKAGLFSMYAQHRGEVTQSKDQEMYKSREPTLDIVSTAEFNNQDMSHKTKVQNCKSSTNVESTAKGMLTTSTVLHSSVIDGSADIYENPQEKAKLFTNRNYNMSFQKSSDESSDGKHKSNFELNGQDMSVNNIVVQQNISDVAMATAEDRGMVPVFQRVFAKMTSDKPSPWSMVGKSTNNNSPRIQSATDSPQMDIEKNKYDSIKLLKEKEQNIDTCESSLAKEGCGKQLGKNVKRSTGQILALLGLGNKKDHNPSSNIQLKSSVVGDIKNSMVESCDIDCDVIEAQTSHKIKHNDCHENQQENNCNDGSVQSIPDKQGIDNVITPVKETISLQNGEKQKSPQNSATCSPLQGDLLSNSTHLSSSLTSDSLQANSLPPEEDPCFDINFSPLSNVSISDDEDNFVSSSIDQTATYQNETGPEAVHADDKNDHYVPHSEGEAIKDIYAKGGVEDNRSMASSNNTNIYDGDLTLVNSKIQTTVSEETICNNLVKTDHTQTPSNEQDKQMISVSSNFDKINTTDNHSLSHLSQESCVISTGSLVLDSQESSTASSQTGVRNLYISRQEPETSPEIPVIGVSVQNVNFSLESLNRNSEKIESHSVEVPQLICQDEDHDDSESDTQITKSLQQRSSKQNGELYLKTKKDDDRERERMQNKSEDDSKKNQDLNYVNQKIPDVTDVDWESEISEEMGPSIFVDNLHQKGEIGNHQEIDSAEFKKSTESSENPSQGALSTVSTTDTMYSASQNSDSVEKSELTQTFPEKIPEYEKCTVQCDIASKILPRNVDFISHNVQYPRTEWRRESRNQHSIFPPSDCDITEDIGDAGRGISVHQLRQALTSALPHPSQLMGNKKTVNHLAEGRKREDFMDVANDRFSEYTVKGRQVSNTVMRRSRPEPQERSQLSAQCAPHTPDLFHDAEQEMSMYKNPLSKQDSTQSLSTGFQLYTQQWIKNVESPCQQVPSRAQHQRDPVLPGNDEEREDEWQQSQNIPQISPQHSQRYIHQNKPNTFTGMFVDRALESSPNTRSVPVWLTESDTLDDISFSDSPMVHQYQNVNSNRRDSHPTEFSTLRQATKPLSDKFSLGQQTTSSYRIQNAINPTMLADEIEDEMPIPGNTKSNSYHKVVTDFDSQESDLSSIPDGYDSIQEEGPGTVAILGFSRWDRFKPVDLPSHEPSQTFYHSRFSPPQVEPEMDHSINAYTGMREVKQAYDFNAVPEPRHQHETMVSSSNIKQVNEIRGQNRDGAGTPFQRIIPGNTNTTVERQQQTSCMNKRFKTPRIVGNDMTCTSSIRRSHPSFSNPQSASSGELSFPSREEVEQNQALSRDMIIPVTFQSYTAYVNTLTSALTEHLNVKLFELANKLHGALGKVDVTKYIPTEQGPLGYIKATTSSSKNTPCEHGIPSKIIQVKKAGLNQGRYFFTCGEPRGKQCKFFQWADQSRKGSKKSARGSPCHLELSDSDSITTYLKGQGIPFYCECQIIRKVPEQRKMTPWLMRKLQQNGVDVTKKNMYLKLSRREGSSSYAKDDIWVISQGLDYDPSCTFLAKSVFFGPTSSSEVEIEPISGYSPSNWPNNVLCHAIHGGNASTELSCIANLQEHVNPTVLPLLPHILNRVDDNNTTLGGFCVPRRQHNTIFHAPTDLIDELCEDFITKYGLNEDQSISLRKVSKMFYNSPEVAEVAVSLVHGVFGAGKSYLVAVMVMFLVKIFELSETYTPGVPQPLRLLISSTTNVAVDRVLMGLLDLGFEEFVRVGSIKKIAKPVLPHSVHAVGSDSQELKDLQDMLKSDISIAEKGHVRKSIEQHRKGENKKKLSRVKVVGVTCAACAFQCLKEQKFPVVMLDECSQMTEPASLLPIARFECHKLVLVGDPKQLDPTIQGSEAGHGQGLEQTMFDRLVQMGHSTTMLRTQYRCHPLISAIPNHLFYSGQLHDGITPEDRPPLARGYPTLCFLDVDKGQEQSDHGGSYYNEAEAQLVLGLVHSLLKYNVQPENIGVITLYKSQMNTVASLLHQNSELKVIQVSTVDAFQGGERGIIILSCVKTHSCGFIDSDKRMNVALSRAKNHLFIVGHRQNLSTNSMWAQVLRYCNSVPGGLQHGQTFLDLVNSQAPQEMVTVAESINDAESEKNKLGPKQKRKKSHQTAKPPKSKDINEESMTYESPLMEFSDDDFTQGSTISVSSYNGQAGVGIRRVEPDPEITIMGEESSDVEMDLQGKTRKRVRRVLPDLDDTELCEKSPEDSEDDDDLPTFL